MAATVRDFMNTQLVYLREGSRPEIALKPILDFGITAVPVLDDDERPVGVVSLRDLVHRQEQKPRVTNRVVSIRLDESIESAAHELAHNEVHHLIVLDEAGRAVGMLSAVDVIRALVGMSPKHPVAIEAFESTKPASRVPART